MEDLHYQRLSKSRGKDLYGHVVGLCSSAGKDDLSGISSNQVCHLLLRVKETTDSYFLSIYIRIKLFKLKKKKKKTLPSPQTFLAVSMAVSVSQPYA